MRKNGSWIVGVLAVVAMAAHAGQQGAAGEGVVVRESANPVAVTLDRLTEVVERKGFTVVARIDHAAGAKRVGRELRPTQVLIFGNPKVGTALMESVQGAALDLPIRVASWQDAKGKVWLSYTDPAALAKRYGIVDRDALVAKMSAALGKLTAVAATAP